MTHDHLASLQHQDNLQSYPMYTVQLFCLERLLNTALHALCIAGIVHHMHLGCLQPQLLSPCKESSEEEEGICKECSFLLLFLVQPFS